VEGRLAVARAALDAHEFAEARASLKPLLATPTRRVATLMAQLEEGETGDIGRARQWMARAVHAGLDPAWTADGLIAENWMPVSPKSGRLDAFQWRVPVADLTPRGPLIEPAPTAPAIAPPAPEVISAVKEIRPDPKPEQRAQPKPESKPAVAPEPKPAPETRPEARIDVRPSPSLDLSAAPSSPPEVTRSPDMARITVPDDPGPEPEPAEPTPRPKPDAGRGFLSWFSRSAAGTPRAGAP
jgi:HemY protein